MKLNNTGGIFRRFLTRALAAGALLAVYCVSTIAVTGIAMTTGVTTAHAQRGRGRGRGAVRGRGRGLRRGRGYYRGGLWVPSVWCHQPWNSRRVYCGW